MQRYINIACGSSYIKSDEWENVDYRADDPAFVHKADILGNFKTAQRHYEVVYCSHFIEHIPPKKVIGFLSHCRSMMDECSLFRIVVPDAEFLLREYLKQKDLGNAAASEFAYLCFLDQCVRVSSGGKLGEFYAKLSAENGTDAKAYATYLVGTHADLPVGQTPLCNPAKLLTILRHPAQLWHVLEPYYVKLICSLLPRAFREQNISFATVGERHLWMYDFDGLKSILNEAGFSQVARFSYDSSSRADTLFVPLEQVDGKPRMGAQQLFVEARL